MPSATLRHTAWILRGNPLTAVAASGVVILVLIAILGPSIAPYDPIASNVSEALLPPTAFEQISVQRDYVRRRSSTL